MLGTILLATFITSLISLVGVVFLSYKGSIQNFINRAVCFSIGALLATVFYGMLPESKIPWVGVFIILSLIIEKSLHWHHCHKFKCDIHPFGWMNIIGDGIHNMTDGFSIAISFLASPILGWTTTLAIIAHEVPQEIGDFFILLKAGFSVKKALFFNFISALTALLGALVGYWLASFRDIIPYLLAFAAGNLLYIAMVDLMPSLRDVRDTKTEILNLGLLAIGFLVVLICIHMAKSITPLGI